MKKSEFPFVVKMFAFWLVGLFVVLFFAVKLVPLQKDFLGGGRENYLRNPYFWAWGNFDGQHYVSIASRGYVFAEHTFFPLYPILVNFLGNRLGGDEAALNFAGIFVSLVMFFIGMVGFYKLLRIDFSQEFSKRTLLFLFIFPTSFYFASVYTESLFLALAVWSLFYARQGKWLYAALLGIFLSATRFVGLAILPTLVVEWYLQNKKNFLKNFPWVILTTPSGLLGYMYYLDRRTHNMLAFFSELSNFGEQRSSHSVILPQVYYRYVFKILPNLNITFFPVVYSTWLEFLMGVLFLILGVVSFFKLRLSYAVFLLLGFLVPTFSGSFSSLPRYVIVLFPAYILLMYFVGKSKIVLLAFAAVSVILLVVSFSLFARGYWIS